MNGTQVSFRAKNLFGRYGPTLAVVAALALLVALLPNRGPESADSLASGDAERERLLDEATGSDTTVGPDGFTGPGGSQTGGGGPGGPGGPGGGGGGPSSAWGPGRYPKPGPDTKCREDGNMPDFSFYSPTCVPVYSESNGGATSQGVTKNDILVVRYVKEIDPATQAALESVGLADPPHVQVRQRDVMVRYFNTHYETYGRQIRVVDFKGTGSATDETVLRADAVQIATLKPFAVVDPVGSGALIPFAEELAARGIICYCVNFTGRGFFQKTAPYNYTSWPTLEKAYDMSAEYIAKRLAGKPAKWAGTSAGIDNAVRRFGLVYLEGQGQVLDPYAKQAKSYFEALMGRARIPLQRSIGYSFNASAAPGDATNIISQLKAAKVNHVVYTGDPAMLVFLTQEATRQTYFPEWQITGILTVDLTLFGRTTDQQQWRRAFGFSPIPVLYDDHRDSPAYAAFHHACPQCNDGDEGNSYAPIYNAMQFIALGVHYAGPQLTPQNFAAGLFAAPPRGGTNPKVYRMHFTSRDYSGMSDFVEVWWNANGAGKDEIGNDGVGRLERANGAKRYSPGTWTGGDPLVFGDDPKPTWRLPDKDTFDHEADKHTHPAAERCRSCGRQ